MYIGRFAPSPTGKLHIGSLYTAVASYCQAMQNNGQWLLRIEDLDPPREIEGASDQIIKTLEQLGFEFNQNIVFQSHSLRQTAYQQALEQLIIKGSVYYCSCSRTRANFDSNNQHLCLQQKVPPQKAHSIKIKVPNQVQKFKDYIQENYTKNLQQDCGDFILKRKDGLFSYQLAVVVDDEFQKINHIIRGIDLIDSTPWQQFLINQLEYQQPSYAHLPILVNSDNQKLSKQTFAKEINPEQAVQSLLKAYNYLEQKPFTKSPESVDQFWNHAIKHWDINKIPKVKSIKV